MSSGERQTRSSSFASLLSGLFARLAYRPAAQHAPRSVAQQRPGIALDLPRPEWPPVRFHDDGPSIMDRVGSIVRIDGNDGEGSQRLGRVVN